MVLDRLTGQFRGGEVVRRILIAMVLAALLVPGSASAKDNKDRWVIYDEPSCGDYLDAYARSALKPANYSGPHEAWEVFGWIAGYISALNRYQRYEFPSILDAGKRGDAGHMAGMNINDARRWVASWCRDNQSEGLDDAINALYISRIPTIDLRD